MNNFAQFVRFAGVTTMAVCFLLLSACLGPITPTVTHTQYYPHIESVDYPRSVNAGEPFEIKVVVSTNSDPSLLANMDLFWRSLPSSVEFENGVSAGTYDDGTFLGPIIVPDVYGSSPATDGPPTNVFRSTLTVTTPGIHRVFLQGLANAEQGGLTYMLDGDFGYPRPVSPGQFEIIELEIEVLPAS